MKRASVKLLAVFIILFAGNVLADEITLLHEFAGGGSDGSFARSNLILDAGMLYGMTPNGGDSNYGTIYKIGTDGAGFQLLHEFAAGGSDGSRPYNSLVLDSGTLYGMTLYGGDSSAGTIFKIGTGGTGFTLLHEFAGGDSDGRNPYGSLVLDGGTIYGMTYSGGDSNDGTIFKIGTDGTGFALLHEFAGGGSDGKGPYENLILDSGTLYGMTGYGGDSDLGTIFKIGTDGTGFTLLHEFAGGGSDGSRARNSLMLDSGTLYGMTYTGGDSDLGTIFKIGTDGTGFALLHEFAGGISDGRNPWGSLILDSGELYGVTLYGGSSDAGVVFKIGTAGTGFELLYEFAGGVADGSGPMGSLVLGSGTLYGVTTQGGDSNSGTIFSLDVQGGAAPELPVGTLPFFVLIFSNLVLSMRKLLK